MDSFHAFWDRINGKMYRKGGPTQYDTVDYAKTLTPNPINNVEGGNHNLRLLSQEDMGRYAADDVTAHYLQMHSKNPLRLGDPMSDMEFKKFYGQQTEAFNSLPVNTEKTIWVDEFDKELSGPDCGQHISAKLGIGKEDYKINFSLVGDDIVEIDFVTRRAGMFLTKGGIPFEVLGKVMAVIGQYLRHCQGMGFYFNPTSFTRARVFDKIVTRMMPEFVKQEDGTFRRQPPAR